MKGFLVFLLAIGFIGGGGLGMVVTYFAGGVTGTPIQAVAPTFLFFSILFALGIYLLKKLF